MPISTGYSLINTSSTDVWYDGLYHKPNISRVITYSDLNGGLANDSQLQADLLSSVTLIELTSNMATAYGGQPGVDKLMSLTRQQSSVSVISKYQEYSLIQDIRPAGVHGGTSREETWNVRSLNTIIYNDNNNASLVGDDFHLSAGTYSVRVMAPASDVEKHKLRVYNETTSIVEFEGVGIDSEHSGGVAVASGIIVSSGNDFYEIQHYTDEKKEKKGLGEALDIGDAEIYTIVEITKLGVGV